MGADEATGRLEAIWLKRGRRAPMDPVARALLVVGRGLEGNANQGGRRQVTLISAEAWSAVAAELGTDVDPRLRRANLLVSGVELAGSRGAILAIGPCRIRVGGETRPCRLMDESFRGLRRALSRDWRGGVYGTVETGGEIAPGDRVTLAPPGAR